MRLVVVEGEEAVGAVRERAVGVQRVVEVVERRLIEVDAIDHRVRRIVRGRWEL